MLIWGVDSPDKGVIWGVPYHENPYLLDFFNKTPYTKKRTFGRIRVKKKLKPMILHPVKHGKNRAIVLTDQMLEAAGLTKSGPIQLIVNPSGGLLLQAIEGTQESKAFESFKKVKRKYSPLFRRLADR